MIWFFFGVVIGICVTLLVLDHWYFVIKKSSVPKSLLKMYYDGVASIALSFILKPPKVDLHKPAPKKAKLTIVKE